jgi:hypothetical protein
MKKSLVLSLISAVVVAVGLCQPSYAPSSHRSSSRSSSTTKTDTWIIVKIGDDYKTIRQADLKQEEKRLKDDYTQKIKEWQDLKKSDPKAEKPVQVAIKRVGPTFKTQKGADQYRQDLDEKEGKGDKKNSR